MLKIDKEKEKKREAEETEDYLDNVEKHDGWKYVGQIEKDKAEKEKKGQDAIKNYLEGQGRVTYRQRLAQAGQRKLGGIDFPKGWEFNCLATESRTIRIYGKHFQGQEGILIILKTPIGSVFHRGFRTCYNPEIDEKALNVLVLQAENTLDSYKGILLSDQKRENKTKSGIYLPD